MRVHACRIPKWVIFAIAIVTLAVLWGMKKYHGLDALPLRTPETKNFITYVKKTHGDSRATVQYRFPQHIEIRVTTKSALSDREKETILQRAAELLQDKDFARNYTRAYERRYGKISEGNEILTTGIKAEGPTLVAVRFYERGDRLSDDYYAQYPFDKWIGA